MVEAEWQGQAGYGLERDDYGQTRYAFLVLETGKDYNGRMKSDATVFWVGDHSRQHAFGLGGGGDFSKTVLRTPGKVTATQKAIDRQHAEVFTAEVVESLTAEAKDWYVSGKDKR